MMVYMQGGTITCISCSPTTILTQLRLLLWSSIAIWQTSKNKDVEEEDVGHNQSDSSAV